MTKLHFKNEIFFWKWSLEYDVINLELFSKNRKLDV